MKQEENNKNQINKAKYNLSLKKEKLLESNDYYIWLKFFTQQYPYFNDHMFGKDLYEDKDFKECPISKENYFKVSQLYVLFSLLDEYFCSIKNHTIVFNGLKKGHYFISDGDKYFLQCEISKDGLVYSCSRLPNNYVESFIDIEEIKEIYNQKKQQKKERLALEKFRNELKMLLSDEIPEYKILEVVTEEVSKKIKTIGTK